MVNRFKRVEETEDSDVSDILPGKDLTFGDRQGV